MPSFRGKRVNRTNGAGAGRGDQPYTAFSPLIQDKTAPILIDGNRSAPMPPSDTRVARKANSEKAKEKALKKVNKNPLTPDTSPFSPEPGFKESEPASAYGTALRSERRLKEDNYGPLMHKTAKEFKETDQDIVGTYLATGKSVWSDEGQEWIGKRDLKKKRDEEYG